MALRLASINRTADRNKVQQLRNKYRPPVFKVRAIQIRRSYGIPLDRPMVPRSEDIRVCL